MRTRLYSRLHALWWLTLLAAVGIVLASLPGYASRWMAFNVSSQLVAFSLEATRAGIVLSLGAVVFSMALAGLLFWKKGNEPMGLFLSFYLLGYALFMCGPIEELAEYWFDSLTLALAIQGFFFTVLSVTLVLVFPNGHFVPRWSRFLVPLAALFVCVSLLLGVEETARLSTPRSLLLNGAAYGVFFLALGIQVYRYRNLYSELERQQTKWVVYGVGVLLLLFVPLSIVYYYTLNLPPGTPTPRWVAFTSVGWWLSLSVLPLAFALAILRSRLWDIDILIRRTVTYALVAAALAVVYYACVISLQRIFAMLSGQQSEVVTVVSTLVIAALFVPLRNRIQGAIDRRFYRKKYDAQKVLQEFGETVRDETDLDKLTGRLLEVVQETMQPRSVSVWLKGANEKAQGREGAKS